MAVVSLGWRGTGGGADAASWPAGTVAGGNVLIVTLDTLRADRLTVDLMPRLSALASTSHRFRTTYAHAPSRRRRTRRCSPGCCRPRMAFAAMARFASPTPT